MSTAASHTGQAVYANGVSAPASGQPFTRRRAYRGDQGLRTFEGESEHHSACHPVMRRSLRVEAVARAFGSSILVEHVIPPLAFRAQRPNRRGLESAARFVSQSDARVMQQYRLAA
jgi:hypothetical protein